MEYQYQKYQQDKTKKKKIILFFSLLIFGFIGLFGLKTGFTISQVINQNSVSQILPSNKSLPELPKDNPDRINILLLGMRGINDPGEGKLLSDTMILLSFDKKTNKVALISIPRDLYVEIWGLWEKRKINFAYAHGGLDCAKKTVSLVTNQYIDYTISVDFQAITKIVDILGGITINRQEPFEEKFQWAKEGWEEDQFWFKKDFNGEENWVFHIPTGQSVLNGSTTLYYVRSRFSTSDFDRMHRQQEVIMAVKNKALSLGVLANPVKIYNLLDLLSKNARTDMSLGDIKNMVNIISKLDNQNFNIKKKVFEATKEGLLYDASINGEYVLLPIGDNWDKIQETCENILN